VPIFHPFDSAAIQVAELGWCGNTGLFDSTGAAMTEGEIRATFILRLWRGTNEPDGAWRGEVESTRSGRMVRFGELDAMFDDLRARLAELEAGRAVSGFSTDRGTQ
jgi:hypothetical protein